MLPCSEPYHLGIMKSYLFLSSTYTSILFAKLLLSYNFGGRLDDLYSDNQILPI